MGNLISTYKTQMKIVHCIWETPVVCKILSGGVGAISTPSKHHWKNKTISNFLLESKLCHKVRMKVGGQLVRVVFICNV